MDFPVSWAVRFLVGLCFALYVSGEILISSRLVYFFQETTNLERQVTEWSLGLFFLSLTAGRLTFAFFDISFTSIKAMLLSTILASLCLVVGLNINIWFLPLTGLFISWFFPVGIGWLGEKFGDAMDAMTASMFTWVNFFLIFMHSGFGIVADKYGIQMAFNLPLYFFIGTFVLLIILDFFILKQRD
jgi:fucose permease